MASPDSEPDTDALVNAWASWWAFLRAHQPWAERGEPICRRLSRFGVNHACAELDPALGRISMGVNLVKAASRWSGPSVGPHGHARAGPTDRARGEQWRLVMAFAGLEKLIKTLQPKEGHGLTPDAIRRFTAACGLSACEGLPAPARSRRPEGSPPVAKANWPEYQGVFRGWLEGQAIRTWPDLILLAQALRHNIAHGSLSAHRTNRGRLRPAIPRLTRDIAAVTTTTLGCLLAEDCTAV